MGSLGARRMHAASDLDVIVIYDDQGQDMSEGRKPLASRAYYARLTQALITAMTAPMSQGRLYEIDMRLRPSGKQGPVATSWSAFQSYQRNEAWLWEHLALTRARVVTGPEDLSQEIEAFRVSIVASRHKPDEVLHSVRDMRDRLAAAKTSAGDFDMRTGPGRLQDIELLAQAGHLVSGKPGRSVPDGLAGAVAAGLVTGPEAEALADAYRLYWPVMMAVRLISGEHPGEAPPAEGAARFLCRNGGAEDLPALQSGLLQRYDQIAAIIEAALERGGQAAGDDG